MCKKFLVLLVSVVAFASAANADVMLQMHTTADTPASGYNTTTITVLSDTPEETIKSVYAHFQTGWMSQKTYGSYTCLTIDGPMYGSIDMSWDSHFLLSYDDISAAYGSGVGESTKNLWGGFTVYSSGQEQALPLAQLVTYGDVPVSYDLRFTDTDGVEHNFLSSFVTPEPTSMVVLMLGGLGLAARRRR
jgi:glutaredoxin-related protein